MAHAENKDLLKAAKEAVKKSKIKKALDRIKNSKPDKKSGSSTSDIFKSYGKYDGKPIELKKGGRAAFQSGGRTNLFEELGRVEGEPSNRNRRAEVSRIHGELNKGYSLGGRVGVAKRGFNKKILRKD